MFDTFDFYELLTDIKKLQKFEDEKVLMREMREKLTRTQQRHEQNQKVTIFIKAGYCKCVNVLCKIQIQR